MPPCPPATAVAATISATGAAPTFAAATATAATALRLPDSGPSFGYGSAATTSVVVSATGTDGGVAYVVSVMREDLESITTTTTTTCTATTTITTIVAIEERVVDALARPLAAVAGDEGSRPEAVAEWARALLGFLFCFVSFCCVVRSAGSLKRKC